MAPHFQVIDSPLFKKSELSFFGEGGGEYLSMFLQKSVDLAKLVLFLSFFRSKLTDLQKPGAIPFPQNPVYRYDGKTAIYCKLPANCFEIGCKLSSFLITSRPLEIFYQS